MTPLSTREWLNPAWPSYKNPSARRPVRIRCARCWMEPDRPAAARVFLVLFAMLAIITDVVPAAAQLDRLRKFKKDPESAQAEQAPMGAIPAGKFWMGVDGLQGLDDERPRHEVFLDTYAMDLYEVTVGRYATFLKSTGRLPPLFWDTVDLNEHRDRPVIGVDWE